MNHRLLLGPVVAIAFFATPAHGQGSGFQFGAHFGADVAQVPDGRGWRGGVQAALAIDQRFDFYSGFTFYGDVDALRTLLAVRGWPMGRGDDRFAAWYLGAGMLAGSGVDGAFITGLQVHSGRLAPFAELQAQSPGVLDVRLGMAVRVR